MINPTVLKQVIQDVEHPMRRGMLKLAEAAFKYKAAEHHPDMGGDEEKFREAQEAIESARAQLGVRDGE